MRYLKEMNIQVKESEENKDSDIERKHPEKK